MTLILAYIPSAQGKQVEPKSIQEANWQDTALTRHTCPCDFLIKEVCVIGQECLSSVGLLTQI